MVVELQINNSLDPRARFVSWAPSPCRVGMTDPSGATTPTVNVQITGRSISGGGQVLFRRDTTGSFSSSLTLPVPRNGTPVPFFTAGRFGRPSINNGDVTIEARAGTTLIGSVPVMVRIRKNANRLTPGERDRLVAAFAELNDRGMGRFADFRDMHTARSDGEAHEGPGFLPWHRTYVLDLERELQVIDPGVALPYWRFDQPAPNIFSREFMGLSDSIGTVLFSATNPLQFWVTDGRPGIVRRPSFNTATQPALVISEAATLALGPRYRDFRGRMQDNPHGRAHTSFGGSSVIRVIGTAARDPLFFLLHCNVDRLWARWQRQNNRFDPAQAASYDSTGATRVGHRLPDTMWPWNGITGDPRPPTAPGGGLASSRTAGAPGPQPRVRDTLDYQGRLNVASRMGFDYDDVPFA